MDDALIDEFMVNVSRQDAVMTLQVFVELCEVKRYYNVEYSYNSPLEKFVLTASKTKHGPTCAFIPYAVHEGLNFLKLHKILRAVPNIIIYLVLVHGDSTCVFYQIAEGLLEPTDAKAKHTRQNRRDRLDNELRRNRRLLEQSALYGIPVTIRTNPENSSNI